ncbi:MAG: hypothetical protein AAGI07_12600 [Bacteroidota bacterium]
MTNHNGANAIWINNTTIALQIEHFKNFEVYDVETGRSLFGSINGELGHKSFNDIIFYSRCANRQLPKNETKRLYPKQEEGIWKFDLSSGKSSQIIKKKKIIKKFIKQNPDITGNDVQILHVESNPAGNKILFDYRHKKQPNDKRRKQLQGFVNADGSGVKWIPERPMHVVWYDNETMFGVEMDDKQKKMHRYDLEGNNLELLAGSACHLGISSDRNWFAGEFGFYKNEPDGFTRVYLYKRNETKPHAVLSAWQNAKITWRWVAHVNPSFSADGKRLYFIRAVEGMDKFEAVYIDLEKAGILRS